MISPPKKMKKRQKKEEAKAKTSIESSNEEKSPTKQTKMQWTETERSKFIEGLREFGKDYPRI